MNMMLRRTLREMQAHFEERLVTAFAAPGQLESAILNLVPNAQVRARGRGARHMTGVIKTRISKFPPELTF